MTRRHMLAAALALLGPKVQPLKRNVVTLFVSVSGVRAVDEELRRMIRAEWQPEPEPKPKPQPQPDPADIRFYAIMVWALEQMRMTPPELHAFENQVVVELSGVGRYDREIARMIRAEVERVKANR